MEKKDQLTLVQIHYLGQKTEDQSLLKQIKNLNLKLINFEKINYNIFPIPNIEIKNAELESIKSETKFQTEKIIIYQKIFGAYDLQNFEGKKCPSFSCESTGNKTLSNKDFEGKKRVIKIY